MNVDDIVSRLREQFADAIGGVEQPQIEPIIVVEATRLEEVARFVKEDPALRCDSLMCITALDLPPESKEEKKKPRPKKDAEGEEVAEAEGQRPPHRLAVVYYLFSLEHRHRVALRAYLPVEDPHVSSVAHLWPAAIWHEREAFDLLGVVFDGHPDLRRILLPDDWEGYPLRKDYVVQEYYEIEGEQVQVPRGW